MNWDYIAGFIDGEGSIVKRREGYNLLISQANFEVLDNIRTFVGCGHIYPLKKRKKHWKDAWVYSAGGYRETHHVLFHVADKLVVKKKQARTVVKVLEAKLREMEKIVELRRYRLQEGKRLRQGGLTYRQIAKELNTDFGYIRRLLIRNR